MLTVYLDAGDLSRLLWHAGDIDPQAIDVPVLELILDEMQSMTELGLKTQPLYALQLPPEEAKLLMGMLKCASEIHQLGPYGQDPIKLLFKQLTGTVPVAIGLPELKLLHKYAFLFGETIDRQLLKELIQEVETMEELAYWGLKQVCVLKLNQPQATLALLMLEYARAAERQENPPTETLQIQ